ncbi:hypothetical protein LINPERPRIM_LOCUS37480, partial [Linum perenne]
MRIRIPFMKKVMACLEPWKAVSKRICLKMALKRWEMKKEYILNMTKARKAWGEMLKEWKKWKKVQFSWFRRCSPTPCQGLIRVLQ